MDEGVISVKSGGAWQSFYSQRLGGRFARKLFETPNSIESSFSKEETEGGWTWLRSAESQSWQAFDLDRKIVLCCRSSISEYGLGRGLGQVDFWPLYGAHIRYLWPDFQIWCKPHITHEIDIIFMHWKDIDSSLGPLGNSEVLPIHKTLDSKIEIFDRECEAIKTFDGGASSYWQVQGVMGQKRASWSDWLKSDPYGEDLSSSYGLVLLCGLGSNKHYIVMRLFQVEEFILAGGLQFSFDSLPENSYISLENLWDMDLLKFVTTLLLFDFDSKEIFYGDLMPPFHPRYIGGHWGNWTIHIDSYTNVAERLGIKDFLITKDNFEEVVGNYVQQFDYRFPVDKKLLESYLLKQAYNVDWGWPIRKKSA